jgi:hypothetical protein
MAKASPKARKTRTKPTKITQIKTPKIHKCIVLFGLDKEKKPRGAYFTTEAEAVVSRMALDLGLRTGLATTPAQLAIARKLPQGNVEAADNKSIPEIHPTLYQKLNDLVGGEIGAICATHPRSSDQIGPAHLVIAENTLEDGWWPAFVVRRHARALVLKWRDYPALGEFYRDIDAVALLRTKGSEPSTPK